jgi:hypothetical protein
MNRIRGISAAVVFAGGALLLSPARGHATYQEPPELRPKYCCAGDIDGDGVKDFQCCTRSPGGCSAGGSGCVINQN